MKKLITALVGIFTLLLAVNSATAGQVVTFTKLSGLTGGPIVTQTGVWRADLSNVSLSEITQIVITDNSFGFGGFTGQFSGFDLDAIKLSPTSVETAAEAAALDDGPDVFDFYPSGTTILPGSQRAPVDPKLFGTVLGPVRVDPTVATLDAFDANATINLAFAKGWVTLGDRTEEQGSVTGGRIIFDLTSPIDTTVTDFSMFLYIGEVGDNGERADGKVRNVPLAGATVSLIGNALHAPEPSSVALMAIGLLGLAGIGYRRRRPRA